MASHNGHRDVECSSLPYWWISCPPESNRVRQGHICGRCIEIQFKHLLNGLGWEHVLDWLHLRIPNRNSMAGDNARAWIFFYLQRLSQSPAMTQSYCIRPLSPLGTTSKGSKALIQFRPKPISNSGVYLCSLSATWLRCSHCVSTSGVGIWHSITGISSLV